MNESDYFNPNLGNAGVLSIQKNSTNRTQILDSLKKEINSISNKSISQKRKEILGIINKHFALNININVDKVIKEKEVLLTIKNYGNINCDIIDLTFATPRNSFVNDFTQSNVK